MTLKNNFLRVVIDRYLSLCYDIKQSIQLYKNNLEKVLLKRRNRECISLLRILTY